MVTDTKVITIHCTEILCSQLPESYVAIYLVWLDIACHRCSNHRKHNNRFQQSLFWSVVSSIYGRFFGWGLGMRLIHAGVAWVWLVWQGCCHTVGVLKQPGCGLRLVFSFVPRPLPALFRGLPCFHLLTVCVHNSTRRQKSGEELGSVGAFIMWMT